MTITLPASYAPSFNLLAFLQELVAPLLAVFSQKIEPGDVERGAKSSSAILDGIFGEGKTLSDVPDDEGEPSGGGDDDDGGSDDDDDGHDEFADDDEDFEFEEDESEDEDEDEDDEDDQDSGDDNEEEDSDEDDSDDDSDDDDDDEDENDSDDNDEDDEDLDDEERESIARRQAKERGRQLKILQAEMDRLELEAEQLRDTNRELSDEVKRLSSARMTPDDDPTFRSEKQKLLAAVDETVLDLRRNGTKLKQEYGTLYDRYAEIRDIASESDRQEAYAKFKNDISMQFSPFEEPLEDLDGEDRREAMDSVNNVLQLLKSQAARTEELIRMEAELSKKATQGQIAIGVQEYESKAKSLSGVLETLGEMPEEDDKLDPGTIEGMLSVILEKQPAKSKELKKAKQTALDLVLGAKPFTQAQIDTMVEKGLDIAENKRKQNKRVELLRKEKLAKFAAFLTLENEISEALKNASTSEAKKAKKEKTLAALGKARRKKKVKKTPKKQVSKPPVSAEYRKNRFVDEIFKD